MHEEIIELFQDKDIEEMQKRVRRQKLALMILALLALAVCLVLIFCTGTQNAPYMEIATVGVSTLAGWVIFYRAIYAIMPLKRELSHAQMLHEEPREVVVGEVAITDERIFIRRGITARRLEVRGADRTAKVLMCESRLKILDGVGQATFYTCHGYLAAFAKD